MKSKIGLIVMSLFFLWSQRDKPKEPEVPHLTADEKFELRTDQVEVLQALDRLKPTPEYQMLQMAQQKQNALIDSLYSKYKLDRAQFTICDGPQASGACAGVKDGDIEIREIPKEKK